MLRGPICGQFQPLAQFGISLAMEDHSYPFSEKGLISFCRGIYKACLCITLFQRGLGGLGEHGKGRVRAAQPVQEPHLQASYARRRRGHEGEVQ